MGREGESLNTLIMEQFALAVSLIPAGKGMLYETHCDWFVEQWNEIMGWKARGYVGLYRDAGILRYVDEPMSIAVVKVDERTTNSTVLEARIMFQILHHRRFLLLRRRKRVLDQPTSCALLNSFKPISPSCIVVFFPGMTRSPGLLTHMEFARFFISLKTLAFVHAILTGADLPAASTHRNTGSNFWRDPSFSMATLWLSNGSLEFIQIMRLIGSTLH
jgi:hypothetical protein